MVSTASQATGVAEEEGKLVLNGLDPALEARMEAIIDKVRAYHPDPDIDMFRRAFTYAAALHAEQQRRSGEPYIIHPLEVTDLIADIRLDIPGLCAGMLHDVVEDTDTTVEELSEMFSPEIAFIVNGVTKLSKYEFRTRVERQAESFRKMFVAMASDIRVILVKLADRVHNMRTLRHMPAEKQRTIARETMDIYAPLANRLGISWIKSELEDQSFRYLYPDEYYQLAEQISSKKAERQRYIQETIQILQSKLEDHGIEADVYGRPKHFYSIFKKMKQNDIGLDQVYDILAFRVIPKSRRECYEVLGIVHSMWRPVPGRFKDYISMPKPNGYQSLHTSVIGPYQERVEVQIRTDDMHSVAEHGVAAHWQYKEGRIAPKDADKFAWLRQLIEWQQELADPDEFMDMVKVDMFSDEVYTLTPQGEIRALPNGATPVDFAYSIHTEVGHHCAGARVNGKIVPLKYKLQNGDTVEIITNNNQRPNPDWLKFVATSRARTKIRQYVRKEQRQRSLEFGRQLLEKELNRYDLSLKKLLKSGKIRAAAEACKIQTEDELFIALGSDKIRAETVVSKVAPEAQEAPSEEISVFDKFVRTISRRKRPGIALDGIEDVMVRYAKCCSPVPGEPIVGFITRGRGLTVHAADCPKLEHMEAERMLDVYWEGTKDAVRPVNIRVLCTDAPGLLAKISHSFTVTGVNIAEAHCRTTEDKRAINTFEVLVSDSEQLNKALAAIRKINGVYSAERVRV